MIMKLDNQLKELIAVGASIAANCQPCLEYHVGKALENGAGEAEIAEAIEIGKLVRRGAASKMDKYALSLNTSSPPEHNLKDRDCGCSSK
jgi:AhpD family alkylhydroperoxidase